MAVLSSAPAEMPAPAPNHGVSGQPQFFVWREFLWGAIAGAFGEGMMHPIDTIKTRIQSQAILSGTQKDKTIFQMVRVVWNVDGLRGFYRGVTPGITGSLTTGATYFGFIESTKNWIDESHPNLGGHWSNFIAGAMVGFLGFLIYKKFIVSTRTLGRWLMFLSISSFSMWSRAGLGDTLGSFVYVPCEVMKQRMQVQGTVASWSPVALKDKAPAKPGGQMYGYYTGMFHAGRSIWMEQGFRGLFAGYLSTLARDVPFAGLMVVFYEALKDTSKYGKQKWAPNSNYSIPSSFEGLLLGGLAGGFSAYLTTPLDVVKTRLQVQGSTIRYKGWLDAIHRIWLIEGPKGLFRGSIPRITWYIPASALTFMAVEFLRDHFKEGSVDEKDAEGVLNVSIDRKGSVKEVA